MCSTGLSRANIQREDCSKDSRLREKSGEGKQHGKTFLLSCSVRKNASILHVILSLETQQILPYLGKQLRWVKLVKKIGEQSFGHTVFIFSLMNTLIC